MSKSKITPENKWKAYPKNWTLIEKDTAQLMLSQSEKLLNETTETAKLISAKSSQLVTIIITLSTITVGYLIQNLIATGFSYMSITAILVLLCLVVSSYYCYCNFKPYKIYVSGEYPHDIITSNFIDNDFTNDQKYVNLILNICDNIESRILLNEDLNDLSAKNNRIAIVFLFLIPFCPAVAYFLLIFFHAIHF
jgi:hypothetical protein